MTKQERMLAREAVSVAVLFGERMPAVIGCSARSLSALIRATRTTKNRNELICIAGGVPAIIQHPDFIV